MKESLRLRMARKLVSLPPVQKLATGLFHRLYYYTPKRTWTDTRWMGHPIRKLPLDVWVYQEILAELRPSLLIETGTRFGGSALLFAQLFDLLGEGRVVSIDLEPDAQPPHPRITYLTGSSTDPRIVARVREMLPADGGSVIVQLDSDHRTPHVRAELDAYADMVTPGSYLIVEDTNAGGHPVHNAAVPDGGPMAAVEDFLVSDARFEVDRSREKFYFTFAPGGFLKRR